MSRRSTPQKRTDQRGFPVFIRVMVPPDGFGNDIDRIHEWLRQRTGQQGYALHADNQPKVEAIGIYLNKLETASELIEKFDLKLATQHADH